MFVEFVETDSSIVNLIRGSWFIVTLRGSLPWVPSNRLVGDMRHGVVGCAVGTCFAGRTNAEEWIGNAGCGMAGYASSSWRWSSIISRAVRLSVRLCVCAGKRRREIRGSQLNSPPNPDKGNEFR